MSWSDGRGVLGWLRRNDPLGGTVKGVIVLFFGALVAVKGAWWVALLLVVLGAGLFVMPIWLHRRDQQALRRWQRRRTP